MIFVLPSVKQERRRENERERERKKKKTSFSLSLGVSFDLPLQQQQRQQNLTPDIENLRRRRDAADAALRADEAERASVQREAAALTRKLQELGERVAAAARARDECAGVLATAEGAYEKILQSAQSLRDVLKAEASEIGGGGGGGRSGRRENGGNGRESSDSGNSTG